MCRRGVQSWSPWLPRRHTAGADMDSDKGSDRGPLLHIPVSSQLGSRGGGFFTLSRRLTPDPGRPSIGPSDSRSAKIQSGTRGRGSRKLCPQSQLPGSDALSPEARFVHRIRCRKAPRRPCVSSGGHNLPRWSWALAGIPANRYRQQLHGEGRSWSYCKTRRARVGGNGDRGGGGGEGRWRGRGRGGRALAGHGACGNRSSRGLRRRFEGPSSPAAPAEAPAPRCMHVPSVAEPAWASRPRGLIPFSAPHTSALPHSLFLSPTQQCARKWGR